MDNVAKENMKKITKQFEKYRSGVKRVELLESQLNRIDNHIKIKTSAIKNYSGNGGSKDTLDCYNDLVIRKIRLENKLLDSKLVVDLMDDALGSLEKEFPLEYQAIRMKHIECRPIYQIQDRLNYGRTKVWECIRKGEAELLKLLEIIS